MCGEKHNSCGNAGRPLHSHFSLQPAWSQSWPRIQEEMGRGATVPFRQLRDHCRGVSGCVNSKDMKQVPSLQQIRWREQGWEERGQGRCLLQKVSRPLLMPRA